MQTKETPQARASVALPRDDTVNWMEIQRTLGLLDQNAREGQSDPATAASAVASRIMINGKRYDAWTGKVAGSDASSDASIVLVVLERCDQDFRSDEEMLHRFRFTASETRVARLLAARRSNREIASELGVTEHTARRHTEKVLRKLGVNSRATVERKMTGCDGARALAARKS